MAKPICVIYFPYSCFISHSTIYEIGAFLNGDDLNGKLKKETKFTDYHWFVFYKSGITEPEFRVFYEKDFDEIKFEELKKLVLESVNQGDSTDKTL